MLYRDYMEEYLTRTAPFTKDLGLVQKRPGRDPNGRMAAISRKPSHEALHTGIQKFDWTAQNRVLLLIGDAPPHPKPRGKRNGGSRKKRRKSEKGSQSIRSSSRNKKSRLSARRPFRYFTIPCWAGGRGCCSGSFGSFFVGRRASNFWSIFVISFSARTFGHWGTARGLGIVL